MNNITITVNDKNLEKHIENNNENSDFEFDFSMCHGPYCLC